MTTPKTYWFHIYRGYRGFLQSVVQPNYYNERGVIIDMKIDISIFKPSKSIITIPYNGYIVENFKRYDSLDIYDSDNKLVYSGHPTRYHWTQNKNSDIIKINLEPYWKNMSLKLGGGAHEYFDDLYELYNGRVSFDAAKRYSETDYINYGFENINLKNTWITTIQINETYYPLINNNEALNNMFNGNNGYEIIKNFIDYEYYKDDS